MLLEQRKAVEHLRHEGLLDDLDATPLVATINQKIEAIMLAPLLKRYTAVRQSVMRISAIR